MMEFHLCDVRRRVELVLLHSQESEPQGTIHWLKARPHLARHHHARISHPKVLDFSIPYIKPFTPIGCTLQCSRNKR